MFFFVVKHRNDGANIPGEREREQEEVSLRTNRSHKDSKTFSCKRIHLHQRKKGSVPIFKKGSETSMLRNRKQVRGRMNIRMMHTCKMYNSSIPYGTRLHLSKHLFPYGSSHTLSFLPPPFFFGDETLNTHTQSRFRPHSVPLKPSPHPLF